MSIPKEIMYLETLLRDRTIREFFRLLGVQDGVSFIHADKTIDTWKMGEHLRAYTLRTEGHTRPGFDWRVLVEIGMTLERSDDDEPAADTMRIHFRGRWYKLKLPKM